MVKLDIYLNGLNDKISKNICEAGYIPIEDIEDVNENTYTFDGEQKTLTYYKINGLNYYVPFVVSKDLKYYKEKYGDKLKGITVFKEGAGLKTKYRTVPEVRQY